MNTAILFAALLLAQAEPAQSQPVPTAPVPNASTQSEASGPYADILLQFGVGAMGGLVTLLGGIWHIRHTEWYRRASRWEPYAELIWQTRQKAYQELYCHLASLNIDAQVMLNAVETGMDVSRRQELAIKFMERLPEFIQEQQGIYVIAGQRVTDCISDLVFAQADAETICEEGTGNIEECRERLNTALRELANALREDLRVDPLDTHFRKP